MIIQRKLKGLIVEHGINQCVLAKLLGVTRETINNKINGKVNFTLPEAVKISKYFNKDIEKIFLFNEFTMCEYKDGF